MVGEGSQGRAEERTRPRSTPRWSGEFAQHAVRPRNGLRLLAQTRPAKDAGLRLVPYTDQQTALSS